MHLGGTFHCFFQLLAVDSEEVSLSKESLEVCLGVFW